MIPCLVLLDLYSLQARHAESIGTDAIASFTPSYYKPDNEGMWKPLNCLILKEEKWKKELIKWQHIQYVFKTFWIGY